MADEELRKLAIRAGMISGSDYVCDPVGWNTLQEAYALGKEAGVALGRQLERNEWIAVDEKLPNENAKEFRYLVHYAVPILNKGRPAFYVGIMGYGWRRNDNCKEAAGGWRWELHFYELDVLSPCNSWCSTVTHWQPLPKPPEAAAIRALGKDGGS